MARTCLLCVILLLVIFTNTLESSNNNEVCQDKSAILCRRYKDDCEVNRNVKRICPVTCGVCGDKKLGPTADPRETCLDTDKSNCNRWKYSNRCEERRLISIMKRLCARTCGFCRPVFPDKPVTTRRPVITRQPVITRRPDFNDCRDRDKQNCRSWRRMGRCRMPHLKSHMERECKKSCGFCQTTRSINPCTRRPCRNRGTCYNMPSSRLGYTCSCVRGWTGVNCTKKICNDIEKNQCKSWKWWGYCDSFNKQRRSRAHQFCAKTCGIC